MQHRSSKPARPCESEVGGVRFPCLTERSERRDATSADAVGHRPVSTSPVGRFGPKLVHPKRVGRPCKNCGGTERYSNYSCVRCVAERTKKRKGTPEYRAYAKRYWMWKRYGLSPEQAELILAAQGGKCGCCGTDQPGNANGWAVDHDHATGAVRAIVCHGCNVGLGGFRDSPGRLRAALAYLKRHAAHRAPSNSATRGAP